IMGAVAFFVYKLVFLLIPVNEVAFIVAFLAAVIVYFSLMILTQAISPTELLSFPKGQLLVKIAKKCKLIPS
ncbi:MAG: polysaccharide biosynthesis protein, partial [Lachnospiraceae bacterium]|nr:polysaccharide biosynthesis protein [Lachnospiraceae bacterium]